MDTASFNFVAFGLAVALVSNLSRSRVWRSAVLMVASAAFLGLLSRHLMTFVPLAGFLLLGYAGLVMIRMGWSRAQALSVLAVILVYVWLKKYTFLPAGIFLHHPYFTLGLSYIVFRVLHLLIEAEENAEIRSLRVGAYLLYTLNFTTLLSGPLQRYEEFARDQFASEPIGLGVRTAGSQLERIVRGLFKVNVVAMLFHIVQQDAAQQVSQHLPLELKLYAAFRLTVVYPLFLYCNFSGYIDIVIALARLMRVRLPENFDRPFSATSFLDFWNRWHITLSTWLKTYVYNPLLLTLMRRVTSRALEPFLGVVCFFVTFFLIGVWHGRTSEFIVFGALQGGGVAINKLWQVFLIKKMGRKSYNQLSRGPVYEAVGRGLTYTWFAFTMFWFWGEWPELHRIFSDVTKLQWVGVLMVVWLAATAVLAAWEWLRAALLSIRTADGPVLVSRYAYTVYASAMFLAAFVITFLLNQKAPDIVYKAF